MTIFKFEITKQEINTTNSIEFRVNLQLGDAIGAETISVILSNLNVLAGFRNIITAIKYNDRVYRLFDNKFTVTDDEVYGFGFIDGQFNVEVF